MALRPQIEEEMLNLLNFFFLLNDIERNRTVFVCCYVFPSVENVTILSAV